MPYRPQPKNNTRNNEQIRYHCDPSLPRPDPIPSCDMCSRKSARSNDSAAAAPTPAVDPATGLPIPGTAPEPVDLSAVTVRIMPPLVMREAEAREVVNRFVPVAKAFLHKRVVAA